MISPHGRTSGVSLGQGIPHGESRGVSRKHRACWFLACWPCLCLWLGLCTWAPATWAQGSPEAREAAVKAGILLNFTLYVDYPTEAFAKDNSPLVICVANANVLYSTLERLAEGKVRRGRPIRTRRLVLDGEASDGEASAGDASTRDASNCHMLYLGPKTDGDWREVLETLQGTPVLTFGEGDEFLDNGGAVVLMRSGNNVRFAINLRPVRAAGLTISSSVLKLAESVSGRGRGRR